MLTVIVAEQVIPLYLKGQPLQLPIEFDSDCEGDKITRFGDYERLYCSGRPYGAQADKKKIHLPARDRGSKKHPCSFLL